MLEELQDNRVCAFLKASTQELYDKNADRQNLPALYNSVGLGIPYQVARQQSLVMFCQTIKNTKLEETNI